jgi:hypothetical protein
MRRVAVRAHNRVKRELLTRLPPLHLHDHRRHARRLAAHAGFLPEPPAAHRDVLGTLRTDGVAVTTLEALALPGTDALRAGLAALHADMLATDTGAGDTVRPTLDQLVARPAVWQWGLSDALLDLAEAHLGVPPRYYGADLRMERATGAAVGVRQWHRDVEDHRMLKVLVWLDDVDLGAGPFEYVPRRHTDELVRELEYVTGFVDDDRLAGVVDRPEWRQGVGPRWTAIVADTRAVFHRARPPIRTDRWSVTFSYTSRTPTVTVPAPRPTAAQRAAAIRGLGPRQLASLPRDFLPRA